MDIMLKLKKILRGRSYVQITTDRDRYLALNGEGEPDIRNVQRWHFFSRALMFFQDGKPIWLPASARDGLKPGSAPAITAVAVPSPVTPRKCRRVTEPFS